MGFLLGERVRESYESRAGKRCGKTKSVAAIRKKEKRHEKYPPRRGKSERVGYEKTVLPQGRTAYSYKAVIRRINSFAYRAERGRIGRFTP